MTLVYTAAVIKNKYYSRENYLFSKDCPYLIGYCYFSLKKLGDWLIMMSGQ